MHFYGLSMMLHWDCRWTVLIVFFRVFCTLRDLCTTRRSCRYGLLLSSRVFCCAYYFDCILSSIFMYSTLFSGAHEEMGIPILNWTDVAIWTYLLMCPQYRGWDTQLFSGRGVRPGFSKCGACELIFTSERGGLRTEKFQIWGLES